MIYEVDVICNKCKTKIKEREIDVPVGDEYKMISHIDICGKCQQYPRQSDGRPKQK